MRLTRFLLVLLCYLTYSWVAGQTFRVASWNIQDLGKTKSAEEIRKIAQIINRFDVVGIQEVVAIDPGGAKAIAKIADDLSRMGDSWDFWLSEPTHSTGKKTERYAYFIRKSKVRFLRASLDTKVAKLVEREPYWLEIEVKGLPAPIWLTNFHSRPHNQEPESEIQHFANYPQRVPEQPLIMLGDWNLDENHPVWDAFYRQGYAPALLQTPTTLKRACKEGRYRNHSIDNIYYPTNRLLLIESGVVDFIDGNCSELESLRHLSDHLPVYAVFELKD